MLKDCPNTETYGDYLVLRQISKNIDREIFSEFLFKYKNEFNKDSNKRV